MKNHPLKYQNADSAIDAAPNVYIYPLGLLLHNAEQQ